MGEPRIKQKYRRAIKRAQKILSAGSLAVLEIENSDFDLAVIRPGVPPGIQLVKICFPGDPDPPPLKNCSIQRWEIVDRKFKIKEIS